MPDIMGVRDGSPPEVASLELPLTEMQQRIWLELNALDSSAGYNMPIAIRCRGEDLDVDALQAALHDLVARRDALRIAIGWSGASPAQKIASDVPAPVVESLDLSMMAPVKADERLRGLALQAMRTEFDLAVAPLLRAYHYKLPEQRCLVLLVVHHLVADGSSVNALVSDLRQLYQDRSSGHELPSGRQLPDAVGYRGYIEWERSSDAEERFSTAFGYWSEVLMPFDRESLLTSDSPIPNPAGGAGALTVDIPADVLASMDATVKAHGITKFMYCMAAAHLALKKWFDRESTVIWTPVLTHPGKPYIGQVGVYMNTVPIGVQFAGADTVAQLLARVRRQCLAAYDNRFFSMTQFIESRPDLSGAPGVAAAMLTWNNEVLVAGGMAETSIAGVDTLRPFGSSPEDRPRAGIDIHLTQSSDGRLSCLLSYAMEGWDQWTAQSFADSLVAALRLVGEDQAASVSGVELLSSGSVATLESWCSGDAVAVSAEHGSGDVVSALDHWARVAPDAIAVKDGGAAITYQQLDQASSRLAAELSRAGVIRGARVAVCMPRSAELVAAYVAILRAGAAYVPIDPDDPESRRAMILSDVSPAALLVRDQDRALDSPEADRATLAVSLGRLLETTTELAGVTRLVAPGDIAYVMYTSGSTGGPKGVACTHRGLRNRIGWIQAAYPMCTTDRMMFKTAVTFDVSVQELTWPLVAGACIVVCPSLMTTDFDGVVDLMARTGTTVVHFVPSMLEHIADVPALRRCGQLRMMLASGEALSAATAAKLLQNVPAVLINLYGPTETSIDVTSWVCDGEESEVPIGRPIRSTRAYLLDRDLRRVPLGAEGELYIGGAGVAAGYLGNPELTAGSFVPDVFGGEPGSRMYATGDMCRFRSDGVLLYRGRRDSQVKVRGVRIELGEIEAVMRRHPDVIACAVTVEKAKSGVDRLVAHVVAGSRRSEDLVDELMRWGAAWLSRYAVPAQIVLRASLPLTRHGKVDRAALTVVAAASDTVDGESLTGIEAEIADIFAGTLGAAVVGATSDFFRLGGDSILAMRAAGTARRRGISMTPAMLFAHRTVRRLAAACGDLLTDNPARAAAWQAEGASLTADVQRSSPRSGTVDDVYGIGCLQEWELHQYHALTVSGLFVGHQIMTWDQHLDVGDFKEAWHSVAQDIEVARSSFRRSGSGFLQVVNRSVDVPVERLDWTGVGDADRALAALVAGERATGFDLESPQQWRIWLIDMGGGRQTFLWLFNYMRQDGWSYPLVLQSVLSRTAGWKGLSRADTGALAPYRNYVDWLGVQDAGAARDYWLSVLQGVRPLRWPSATATGQRPNARRDSYTNEYFKLQPETARRVREFARGAGITLNTLLQAGWALMLSRRTGRCDVVFGTVTSGRQPAIEAVESVVGNVHNLIPVRAHVSEVSTLEWLQDLQESLARGREFDYVSLRSIREWVGLPYGEDLFDTYLVFENFPVDAVLQQSLANGGAQVSGMTQTEHTVRLTVWPGSALYPGEDILVVASFYRSRISRSGMQSILSEFEAVLLSLSDARTPKEVVEYEQHGEV